MAGQIQNEDIKSVAELTSAGGTAAQLPNDTKVWVTANSINKTLQQAIIDGDIGAGGSGSNKDLVTFSPTTLGFNPSSTALSWARQGMFLLIRGQLTVGSPDGNPGQISFPLPGLTTDSSLQTGDLVGKAIINSDLNVSTDLQFVATTGASYVTISRRNPANSNQPMSDSTACNAIIAPGSIISVELNIPITEWRTAGATGPYYASYEDTTGMSLSTSPAVVLFADQIYDPQSAFDGSTGTFTAPATGYYRVGCTVVSTGSTLDGIYLICQKNGSGVAAFASGFHAVAATSYSTTVSLVATIAMNTGDTLQFLANTTTGSQSLETAAGYNRLNIEILP